MCADEHGAREVVASRERRMGAPNGGGGWWFVVAEAAFQVVAVLGARRDVGVVEVGRAPLQRTPPVSVTTEVRWFSAST